MSEILLLTIDFPAKVAENSGVGRFQTGHPKPTNSGRQRGVPNRKTLILKEALDLLGHDLPTKITELLPKLSPEKQMDVYLELMQYVYPRRKAVEISGQDGQPIEFAARNENLKRVLTDPEALVAFEKLEGKLVGERDAEPPS